MEKGIKMLDWNNKFSGWSSGPGDVEKEKINHAVEQVRKAISNDSKLNTKDISVFVQGSYRNNVNVRQDSDVDVGILCKNTFQIDARDINVKNRVRAKYLEATYLYPEFKRDVENALVNYFGQSSVTRKNKAFDIKENTYRVESDAIALFEYRKHWDDSNCHYGVFFCPDNGDPEIVINWPDQNDDNGTKKNAQTNRRFKRVVRIMKKLKHDMIDSDSKYSYLNRVPGYLIENLVWNVPNDRLILLSYYEAIRSVIIYIYDELKNKDDYLKWTELNKLKWLFVGQKWNKDDVVQYMQDAWNYIGYK